MPPEEARTIGGTGHAVKIETGVFSQCFMPVFYLSALVLGLCLV
jgi:hypothetical protein